MLLLNSHFFWWVLLFCSDLQQTRPTSLSARGGGNIVVAPLYCGSHCLKLEALGDGNHQPRQAYNLLSTVVIIYGVW